MRYMDHYQKIQHLVTLLGDFPALTGPVERRGDSFYYANDLLEVTACFLTDETGVTKRTDTVRNLSDRPITLRSAFSKFVFSGGRYQVYTQYNENLDEGQGQWQNLVTEVAARGKELRCSFENAPFMALWSDNCCRGLAVHIFQNCQWACRVRKDNLQLGSVRTVILEAGVDNGNFSLVLQPGESFQLPQLLLYSFRSKLDMDAWKLHRYCNRHFMKKPLPAAYNSWMSKFDLISYDILAQQVPLAKKLGLEYFVIDAGWFGEPYNWANRVGDWEEHPTVGMAGRMGEFADLVRANGMKFGLWFEIERAALESKAYQAHPEWYKTENTRAFLDFAIPEAREFAFQKVAQNIRKYNIEYIKFDFNATLSFDDRAAAFLPYFEGYRSFMKRIREEFPQVYLSGCASGGMRIAPATLEFFDSYWLSDQQDIHEQVEIFKNVVKRMPNRALETWVTIQTLEDFQPRPTAQPVDRLITGNGTWTYIQRTTTGYVKAAMMGGPASISCDLTRIRPQTLEDLAQQIARFKEERPFWENSECRILAENDTVTVLQYNDPEFSKVKVHVYIKAFHQNAVTVYPVCPADARYRDLEGREYTGRELNEEGMEQKVGRQNTAAVLELERI